MEDKERLRNAPERGREGEKEEEDEVQEGRLAEVKGVSEGEKEEEVIGRGRWRGRGDEERVAD